MSKLLPASTSGKIYTKSGDFDCAVENANGNIVSVCFYNTGANSNAVISYGGITITLAPGVAGQGMRETISMPSGYFDTTRYRISFNAIGLAGAAVNSLSVSYVKEGAAG
jgi:hypothetical protein